MWLLLACFTPAPAEPPVPEEAAAAAAVLAAERAGAPEEGPDEEAEAPAAEPEADRPAADAPDEAEVVPPPPVDPYRVTFTRTPVTVVDDFGTPVYVVDRGDLTWTVYMEEKDRKKVRCNDCGRPVEGWVQSTLTSRP